MCAPSTTGCSSAGAWGSTSMSSMPPTARTSRRCSTIIATAIHRRSRAFRSCRPSEPGGPGDMVTHHRSLLRVAMASLWLAGAGCGRFQDPNVVVDLRILALTASPPDQIIDVDLTQPVMPQTLLAQLVSTEVCALVADPVLDRRLLWTLTMCPGTGGGRCDGDQELPLVEGLLDDPDTTVPEPRLCATIAPDGKLFGMLAKLVEDDGLHGLGGIDYSVQLRIGG